MTSSRTARTEWRALPKTLTKTIRREKTCFLRNEPTVLEGGFLCITLLYKHLYRLQARFAGGFVLENEPTG